MDYRHLSFSTTDHITRVILHRPPVNALNQELVAELIDVANQCRNDESVWLIVVTAEGSTFCAGADLKERAGIPENEVINVVIGIQTIVQTWSELPQPVIMGVNGAALGGGLEFVLSGDIVVAGDKAVFGLPEVSLGIIPAAGGTQRIAQRSTMGVAKKWILSAHKYSASEAREDGIVDFIVSSDNFASQCESIVQMVASNAPLALRQAKRAIESYFQEWLHDGFEHELLLYGNLIPTHDRVEALKAFQEKRKPHWKGS